ncbi:MAG: adenylate/guanylate cyclase domain-containing protein [Ferruginibacter sp.]
MWINCRFLVLNIFLFLSFSSKAQSNEIDSLQKLLSVPSITDSAKVDLLNTISKSFISSNPDTAIVIANSAKSLAEHINYQPGLALALKNIGLANYTGSKYKDAIVSWQQAQDVYQLIGDKKGVANMLSNQGAVFFNQGDDAKALELDLKSLKMSEELNDTLRILTSLINIGTVYLNKQATYKDASDYFLRAYRLSLAIRDNYSIGVSAVNLGETYFKMGKDSSALAYLYESRKACEGTEDLSYTLNVIGRVYVKQKKFEEAIKIHREAYESAKKLDTRLYTTQSLIGLAQAYYAKGDIDAAINAYKQAVEIGMPLNLLAEMKDAYQGLSEAYLKESDFTNAFKYQNLLLAVKDTIYNTETDKKLGTLQFGFDLDKKQTDIEIRDQEIKRQRLVKYGFIGGFAIVLLFAVVFFSQRNRIKHAKRRSDELLLNILPEETAEELKETGSAKTKSFESVSVLFTDFKNFTIASEILTPEELVAEINYCYSEFDRIVSKYGIEKIKTIGDSYMCAGGLPVPNTTHTHDVVMAGLEMVNFIEENKKDRIEKGRPYFELRCGIHTGPVVAGIVGTKKFAYDIWGDTVNTASRMESSGGIGKVNISGSTYELIKDKFTCTPRGKVEAKNKGSIEMYFVEGYA